VAAPDMNWFSAPHSAAPELSDYLQFKPCQVPEGSGASKAHQGFIRPFSDDVTAQRVLRALEQDRALHVAGGRLDADYPDLPKHPLEEFLVDMAVPFTVVALEFSDSQRPRTYLLDPPMVPRLSECHHLRRDKSILIDGIQLPALCVYSGNLFKFEDGKSHIEQVLDQTATYLAKYLVWLRTRELFRRVPDGVVLVRPRKACNKITMVEVLRSDEFFWSGHWPGRSAPSGPVAHLATVKPEGECWCWSGKRYTECCMPRESKYVANLQCHMFVYKLMSAVWSKLRLRC